MSTEAGGYEVPAQPVPSRGRGAPATGSADMTVGPRGSEPAGTLHAVDDERRAVCGVGRQRFVFPAIRWSAALEAACPDCHAAFATRERARPLA